jgi:hypothetical protein
MLQVYIALFTPIHLLLYTATGVLACVAGGIFFSYILPATARRDNTNMNRPMKKKS